MTTKSQTVANELAALIRSRVSLIWIVTREEERVEGYIVQAAASAKYVTRTWDVVSGFCDPLMDGRTIQTLGASTEAVDALAIIEQRAFPTDTQYMTPKADRCVWIMRDLPDWIAGPLGATPRRRLRNLARRLPDATRDTAQAVVILTPSSAVPPELAGQATVIEWPLPDRDEIEAILDAVIDTLPDEMKASAPVNGTREQCIDSAIGLDAASAKACYGKSLVTTGKIDPVLVTKEKKQVIAKERVLEWYDPIPGGLAAVGGLEVLKGWLMARASAFTVEARTYGLPAPKGCLLVGIPGCGKTLTAKAISTAWQCPLLKMDMGALKGKYVGESEGNLRKARTVVEAVGRCVVWIDEIEKALAGATQGAADGGVSADALGFILTWMQESKSGVFFIATANDISALPPELLRKGRFDEIFFVGLPTRSERAAIAEATLLQMQPQALEKIDLNAVADKTGQFTGAEIAAMVPEAMFTAFNDGKRLIKTGDILAAAALVKPLAETAKEKIAKLNQFVAEGRARNASAPEVEGKAKGRGALDI